MKRFISVFFLLFIGCILIAGNAQAKAPQEKTSKQQTVKVEKEKAEKKARSAKATAKQAKTTTQKVNVNTADAKTLQTLPGIGPKIAEQIIQHREKQKFSSAEDLLQVKGIGEKNLKKLLPLISFR